MSLGPPGVELPPFMHGRALHALIDWGFTTWMPPRASAARCVFYWSEEMWYVAIPGVEHYILYHDGLLMLKDLQVLLTQGTFDQLCQEIGNLLAAIDPRMKDRMREIFMDWDLRYFRGVSGPAGEVSPVGPPGATGAQGLSDPVGPTGPQSA